MKKLIRFLVFLAVLAFLCFGPLPPVLRWSVQACAAVTLGALLIAWIKSRRVNWPI